MNGKRSIVYASSVIISAILTTLHMPAFAQSIQEHNVHAQAHTLSNTVQQPFAIRNHDNADMRLAIDTRASLSMREPQTQNAPQKTGNVVLQSNQQTYQSLESALVNAQDNDVLSVSGNITLKNTVSIEKNITIQAGTKDASITKQADEPTKGQVLTVDTGKKLTLGGGAHKLIMNGIHVKVTNGSFHMLNGVHIISNCSPDSIIEITGNTSSATFDGGIAENPHNTVGEYSGFHNSAIVTIRDGAHVDRITAGTFLGSHKSFDVFGKATRIDSITGGRFSDSVASGVSEPGFKLSRGAHIGMISGGTFEAFHFGALQCESEASIDEIAGGTFTNPHDARVKYSPHSGAKPYFSGLVLYGRSGSSSIVVKKISGGTFTGINGLLAVGDEPKQTIKIGSITGGTFQALKKIGDAGLYFSQNTYVETLSGPIRATGINNGLWNAGTIERIQGGEYTSTGEQGNGLENNDYSNLASKPKLSWTKHFRGVIREINGGTYRGSHRAIVNSGIIDTISNGIFVGGKHAIFATNKTGYGNINTIKNGVFYAKNDVTMQLASPLQLEPDLTTTTASTGSARYYAPDNKPIINDEKLVTYPQYVNQDGSKTHYFMSSAQDTKKDVSALPKQEWRFLRQGFTITYHYNVPNNAATYQVNIQPGQSVQLLADAGRFGKRPQYYRFAGWNTSANGKGTWYAGDETLSTVVKDLDLYAIWKVHPETINTAPELVVRRATLTAGESFDLRSLVVRAHDAEDGDLTKKVQITSDGGFNNTVAGEYTIIFTLTDTVGIRVSKRAVVVVKPVSKVPDEHTSQDHEHHQTDQSDTPRHQSHGNEQSNTDATHVGASAHRKQPSVLVRTGTPIVVPITLIVTMIISSISTIAIKKLH